MQRYCCGLIAILVWSLMGSFAQGDQIYEIVFDAAEFSVGAGDNVDVTVLLRETVTDGDTARLAVGGDDGIFFMGVGLDFSSVIGGPGSAFFGAGDVTFNSAFDSTPENTVDVAGLMADMTSATVSTVGVEVPPASFGVYEVEMATISFLAGAEGSVTTLQLSDHSNVAFFSLFGDAFVFDGTYGSATITVASIPEPGTTGLLALGMIGLFVRRKKR